MKLLTIPFFICLNACSKKEEKAILPAEKEAEYSVQIKLNWTSPSFTVPVGAHFSNFVGIVHSADASVWRPGDFASPGLEYIAEIGHNLRMEKELDSIIAHGKGIEKFNLLPPLITGNIDTVFNFTIVYSSISFASMLAPSPDWFVGVSNANLLVNNQWLNELTIPLLIYDAGTEDGDIFGYDNPESSPKQSVHLLTPATGSVLANGNAKMAPIGTVRFTRL